MKTGILHMQVWPMYAERRTGAEEGSESKLLLAFLMYFSLGEGEGRGGHGNGSRKEGKIGITLNEYEKETKVKNYLKEMWDNKKEEVRVNEGKHLKMYEI